MKSMKIKVLITILVILTVFFTVIHLNSREQVSKDTLLIKTSDKNHVLDITSLNYERVTGVRVNGKGEEISVDAQGILLKDILEKENILEYDKVILTAEDSYQVEVTAEEIQQEGKVYFLYEKDNLRLIVFGDENSKRSVSNVSQMTIEFDESK